MDVPMLIGYAILHLAATGLCQFSPAPMTITTFQNRQVKFACGTSGHLITWTVNGTEARYLHSRGVTFNTTSAGQDEMSTLYINASLANNNSEITCILNIFDRGEVNKTSAFLYIQGLLDQPQNICIVSNSYSLIHFKWSPPFSLTITDSELKHQEAILYYDISIKSNNEILRNTTIDTEYVYQLRNPQSHCNTIEFKVAAVNEVGRGNESEGIETGFTGSIIGGNLSNRSVGTGEWISVSCKILCTQNELVTWFINGSALPSLERSGVMFRRLSPYTSHSHCNSAISPQVTTQGLSLRFDHQFDTPVDVYCAIVSICDMISNTCTPTMCFSDVAYLEVVHKDQTTSESEMQNTTNTRNDQQPEGNPHQLLLGLTIAFGSAMLGAIVVLIVTISVYKLYHLNGQRTDHDDPIYEMPMCTSIPSGTSNISQVDVPSTRTTLELVMDPCPAYETATLK